MEKIKLENGFECEVDEGVVDDMELLDAVREAEKGDGLAIFDVIDKVLGKEQKKKLYDKYRDPETGRVPVEPVSEAIGEIISKIEVDGEPAGKNL